MGRGRGESKVVYQEGGHIRAIRGLLIGEDEHFFILLRRDGELRIRKDIVLKIEEVRP